jgi:rhodanese-related sulfurtransferase
MRYGDLPLRAWAILDDDQLAIIDYRTPIFWIRRTAKEFNEEHLAGLGRIVRVEIREVRK